MGKWSVLKGQLPKFVNPDDDFNSRVEKFKGSFADKPCEHGKFQVLQHFQAEGKWWAEIEDGCVHETPIMSTLSKADLARRRKIADELKDKLNEKIKAINVALEAYNRLILERLEDSDETSFKLEDGTTTYIEDTVTITVDNKAAFYQWIRDNKLEDLFTVNYQTVSSMVKNSLVDGKPIPPGISTFFLSKIRQRGGK